MMLHECHLANARSIMKGLHAASSNELHRLFSALVALDCDTAAPSIHTWYPVSLLCLLLDSCLCVATASPDSVVILRRQAAGQAGTAHN